MKKLYVLIIGMLACANIGFAQCGTVNLFVSSQSQIDSFPDNYPGCTTLNQLVLQGDDITNLDGLSQITLITGDCDLGSRPDNLGIYRLTDISGLNNVTSVGGTLRFYDMPNLTTTNFFSSLTFVGGLLQIDSRMPNTLNGFNSVTQVNGSLQLVATLGLKNLDCFQALQGIGDEESIFAGMLYITGGDEIESISGFSNLSYLRSDIWLTNTKLTSAFNLPMLTSVSNLRIYNNSLLTNVSGFSGFSIIGDLAIADNPLLATCNVPNFCAHLANDGSNNITRNARGCASETQVLVSCGTPQNCDANISLQTQQDVDDFAYNYGCTQLTGSLYVDGAGITNLNGLSAITSIQGSLGISNTSLSSLTGLDNVTQIGGGLTLDGNTQLTNINTFSDIESLGGALTITGNTLLAVCNNAAICNLLPTVSTTTIYSNASGCNSKEQILVACGTPQNCNDITLSSQEAIDDFAINYGCTAVTGTFTVTGTGITNLNGIDQIVSAGNIVFSEVPNLTDYLGLNNLTSVSGNFSISGNTAATISGFTVLQSIGGNLSVYNTGATSISVFSNLETVSGNFDFTSNSNLSSLSGFGMLESVTGEFTINSNAVLVSLPAMAGLVSSGPLSILSNPALTSLSGLDNLALVNGNLAIDGNIALMNLNPLDNLTSVIGSVAISGNTAITSLSGIDNINWQLVTSLQLTNNANLATCNVPFICDYIANAGVSTISGNAPTCENATVISVACGEVQDCENVYLFSQADVDNYVTNYGCTTITGSLNITGNDITNLDTLTGVTSIGDLNISGVPLLTDFSGLDNVTELTGGFYLSGATTANVSLLPNVIFIYGSLNFYNAPNLVSVSGFDSLEAVVDVVSFNNNDALTQLPDFTGVYYIGGDVIISSNALLANVAGFSAIEGVNASIIISSNASLTDISGFANVDYESIGGLQIFDNAQLAICNIANFCQYLSNGGDAVIYSNSPSCDTREAVIAACYPGCPQGDLILQSQTEVDDFAINNAGCTTALGNVLISGNDIVNLNGISGLTSILGNLTIVSNDQLTNVNDLANLANIQGSLYINENPLLADLNGLGGITSVYNLEVKDNDALTNLDGLTGLSSIENLTVGFNNTMTTLDGMTDLQNVNGTIRIEENPALTSLSGLNISSVTTMIITNNAALTTMNGLENLQTVYDLQISLNNGLTSLEGLENLTSVTHGLYVNANAVISSLTGLSGLQSAPVLEIFDNPFLANLNALSTLNAVNTINLTANTNLNDISGLTNINASQLTSLTIQNNPNLAICNYPNLCSYISQDGYAVISGNATGCATVTQVGAACGFVCANYYQDNDQDGFGAGSATFTCAGAPVGYVTNDDDCNDNDEMITTECHVSTVLNLKLFIQGYFNPDTQTMTSVKLNQGESANAAEVEELTVSLYDSTTLTVVTTTTAMLQTNGDLITTFDLALDDAYYIVINGRNIVETWSLAPIMITVGSSFDFSLLASQAYGGNQVEVSPGIFALYSGDMNQDGNVNPFDYTIWETDSNQLSFGAITTDLNGDGFADPFDYTIWEENANALISIKSPFH